jgi:hypothetical protein
MLTAKTKEMLSEQSSVQASVRSRSECSEGLLSHGVPSVLWWKHIDGQINSLLTAKWTGKRQSIE